MRHRVGSTYWSGWLTAPLIVAVGFTALAAYMGREGWTVFYTLAAPAMVVTVTAGFIIRRNRRFVEIESDGFVFEDRHGVRRMGAAVGEGKEAD